MNDPATGRPLFTTRCIELCCEACKEAGKQAECVHMLHLVPSWQSEERHRKLKIMMQDRPDLIQSELAGLAFDSLQQVFRKGDIALMFDTPGFDLIQNQVIWTVVDPAAGGPQSDYAIVSICRHKGCVQVRLYDSKYVSSHFKTNSCGDASVLTRNATNIGRKSMKKRESLLRCDTTSILKRLSFIVTSTLTSAKKTKFNSA